MLPLPALRSSNATTPVRLMWPQSTLRHLLRSHSSELEQWEFGSAAAQQQRWIDEAAMVCDFCKQGNRHHTFCSWLRWSGSRGHFADYFAANWKLTDSTPFKGMTGLELWVGKSLAIHPVSLRHAPDSNARRDGMKKKVSVEPTLLRQSRPPLERTPALLRLLLAITTQLLLLVVLVWRIGSHLQNVETREFGQPFVGVF